jgi:hypothetical protein
MRRGWLVLAAGIALGGCAGEGEAPPKGAPAVGAVPGAFASIEAEILVPKCSRAGCHAGARPAGELDLSRGNAYGGLVGVAAARRPERLLVTPGNAEGSYLLDRLVPGGDTPLMPVGAPPLSEAELERLRDWIQGGAKP